MTKEAQNAAQKRYRLKHPETNRRLCKQYRARNVAKRKAYTLQWHTDNREKRLAHKAVYNAVTRGKIVKPKTCNNCELEARLHAHHADYTKRLDVLWLCARCHKLTHMKGS